MIYADGKEQLTVAEYALFWVAMADTDQSFESGPSMSKSVSLQPSMIEFLTGVLYFCLAHLSMF